MFKNLLRRLGKLFVYVSYPIILIALIAFVALFFVRNKQLQDLESTFEQARQELNSENADKQITIEDLQAEFTSLTAEVSSLRTQNAQLEAELAQTQLTGYGTIAGEILPFITSGTADFSQYQRVCAESVANPNLQICRTVPAIAKAYTLSVPVGKYKVYAEIFPTPNADSALFGAKAYYTAYVACVQDKSVEECNEAEMKAALELDIKAGVRVSKVDPISWQK